MPARREPVTAEVRGYGYRFTAAEVTWIQERIGELLTTGAHLTMGRYGEEVEEHVARIVGTRYAIAVTSGTAALEAVLRSLNVAGGEVVLPTNTFGASAVAVLRAGATPVLADTADDLNVDVADLARRITSRTKAVLTVHIGGRVSASTDELDTICKNHGLPLVEDGAHAMGATYHGVAAGAIGRAAGFSLFATKVLTSAEGGLVVTNDASVAATVRLLRDHAKRTDGTMAVTGYNWRLSELHALLALSQVRAMPELLAARQAVVNVYTARLPGLERVRTLAVDPASIANGYKYPVFTARHDIGHLDYLLRKRYGVNLGGYVYRTPLHEQPAFTAYAAGDYPGARAWCPTHFCPPTHPNMTAADAHRVVDALADALPQTRIGSSHE